jgi:hypothetical protein
MLTTSRVHAAALLMLLGGASSVSASPITITPVTGLTFTLENLGLSATQYAGDGVAQDTYDIKVTLTLNGTYVPNVASGDYLKGLGIDAGSGFDFVNPVFSTTAPGTWTLHQDVNVNPSSQCAGADAGTVCFEENTGVSPDFLLSGSGTYNWIFSIDLPGAFGGTTGLDVGVVGGTQLQTKNEYLGSGGSIGPTVLDVPPSAVPEPASLMLLGSGLALVANRLRRRRS